MGRKPSAPAPVSASLSAEQIKRAIPALERRIADLKSIDGSTLTEENGDNVLNAAAQKVNATLRDIFGPGTIEYREYEIGSLNAYSMVVTWGDNDSDSIRARFP